ncbi:unnamed protein product, partial [Polarella glacialis]
SSLAAQGQQQPPPSPHTGSFVAHPQDSSSNRSSLTAQGGADLSSSSRPAANRLSGNSPQAAAASPIGSSAGLLLQVRQRMEQIAKLTEVPVSQSQPSSTIPNGAAGAPLRPHVDKAQAPSKADATAPNATAPSEIEDLRRQLRGSLERDSASGPIIEGATRGGCKAAKVWESSSPADTRASSPGALSHAGSSAAERVTSLKERQLAELRAQVARCGKQLFGTVAAEQPHPEPERTGQRSPCPGSAQAPPGRQAGTLEEELSWTVQQMEVHRRQIEAHQRQLSILERRHAELVTVMTRGTSYGGQLSPGSSVAGKMFASEDAELPPFAAAAASEVCSISSSTGGGLIGAMAAVEARLGLRSSRPASANSALSAGASGVRTPLPLRSAARPQSAGSGCLSPGGSAVAGGGTEWLENEPPSTNPWASDAAASSVSNGLRPSTAIHSQEPGAKLSAPSGSEGNPEAAERIPQLLEQLSAKRQMRVPFSPLAVAEGMAEGDGLPYLHGALEVRLHISEDGNRLLVRVAKGGGGKLFEIYDFIVRAEAIEARRRSPRPNTIEEESEQFGTCQNLSPRSDLFSEAPQFLSPERDALVVQQRSPERGALVVQQRSPERGALGAQSQDLSVLDQSSSSLPWKNLFKAHWPAR